MNRVDCFDIITASNKDLLSNEGRFCQVWGIILSELKSVGNMHVFGVAINENCVFSAVLDEEHGFFSTLKEWGKSIIGELIENLAIQYFDIYFRKMCGHRSCKASTSTRAACVAGKLNCVPCANR